MQVTESQLLPGYTEQNPLALRVFPQPSGMAGSRDTIMPSGYQPPPSLLASLFLYVGFTLKLHSSYVQQDDQWHQVHTLPAEQSQQREREPLPSSSI